jgi:hypothetical protein
VSASPARAALKDPAALHLDWEHAHWAAQDVDLTRDPAVPPPSEGAFDALGVDDGALAAFGLDALSRRLAIIGVPLHPSG